MQQCSRAHMQALRGLCRRAVAGQLPLQRVISGNKASKALSTGCQLPHHRDACLAKQQPKRGLATSRAVPQAAAVEAAPTSATPASNGGLAPTASVPTFQEAIARLQEYWAGIGCALWLPHNTEVRLPCWCRVWVVVMQIGQAHEMGCCSRSQVVNCWLTDAGGTRAPVPPVGMAAALPAGAC